MDLDPLIADCLRDVPDPLDFTRRLGDILGVPMGMDGSLNVNISIRAETKQEARARTTELKLKLSQLKTDVVQGRQKFNSAVERLMNALPNGEARSIVRKIQISYRENYTKLIQTVDSLILQLKTIREVQ